MRQRLAEEQQRVDGHSAIPALDIGAVLYGKAEPFGKLCLGEPNIHPPPANSFADSLVIVNHLVHENPLLTFSTPIMGDFGVE